jgi:rubrerythrin
LSFLKEVVQFYKKFSDPGLIQGKSPNQNFNLSRRLLLRVGLAFGALQLFLPNKLLLAKQSAGEITGKSIREGTEVHNLLNLALKHEHGAIVQYANHAGLISANLGGKYTQTIQSIINDEVGHAITLARELKKAGLNPTLAVWPPKTGTNASQLLAQDVAAEKGAVDLYGQILSLKLSNDLTASIEAIQQAEMVHRETFSTILTEIE